MVEDVILRIEKKMSSGKVGIHNKTTDYPPKEKYEFLELLDRNGNPCIAVGDSYYNYEALDMLPEDALRLADAIYAKYKNNR